MADMFISYASEDREKRAGWPKPCVHAGGPCGGIAKSRLDNLSTRWSRTH